jgi:putative redox protein
MRATVKLLDGVAFEAQADSGPKVIMDGAPEYGGRNRGPRPMELVLMGMGGCTAFDVVYILRRQRQEVTNCVVEIEAERAPSDPKVFTRIHVHFVVTGRKLRNEHVRRAVELSADKYCSASIMLGKTAKITHDYEIVEGAIE